MDKNYKKIFNHLKTPEPPVGLFDKVMTKINEEQRLLTIKRRLVIFSVGLVGSVAAFIPVLKITQTEFYESGFLHFFSLIFSDFGTVVSYWQSLVMSLLERLPVINLAILLAIFFVFLESLKFLVKDIKLISSRLTKLAKLTNG